VVLWVTARILALLTLYTNGKDILWHNMLLSVLTHDAVTGWLITTFATYMSGAHGRPPNLQLPED
jgi:hypothetical protein